METITLDIHKPRKAIEVIKDAFAYMTRDARVLLQALSIYSLGLIAVALLISYSLIGTAPTPERVIGYKDVATKNNFLFLVLSAIVYLGGYCTFTFAVNRLMFLRDARLNNSYFFKEIQPTFWEGFKTYIFNFVLVYIIYFSVNLGLTIFSRSNFLLDASVMDPDPTNYVLELLILNVPSLLILPLLFYFCLSALFVSHRNNVGTSEALKKVFVTTQANFRKIWGCSILVILISYIGTLVVNMSLNYIAYFLFSYFSDAASFFMLSSLVQKVFALFFFLFIQIAIVILYGSVEDEVEGHYIRKKIDTV
jgi:hypothetical protein